MKNQFLKIAKVKNEAEFYRKFPTEEAFMAKHGKALEKAAMGKAMVNKQLKQLTDFGNPPIAQNGAATPKFEFTNNLKADGLGSVAGAAGMNALQSLDKVIGGVQAIEQQKKNIKNAQMSSTISGLGLEAITGARRNQPKNQYVRPEDNLIEPDQLGSSQGVGTNFLQMKSGGEIQNTYAPGTLYDNLGYEPLNNSVKQYAYGGNLPKAEFGQYFQDSGQAQIGSVAGEALGSALFGPAGGAVGKMVGRFAGNLSGGAKQARQLKAAQDATLLNQQQSAFQGTMQNQFGANLKDGGYMNPEYNPQVITKFGEYDTKDLFRPDSTMNTLRSGGHLAQVGYIPPSTEAMFTGRRDVPYNMEDGGYMAMGGNLQTHWGGDAELMSYNPYIPGGGETVMFRGQSHDETNGKGQSGIGITYGDNPVEVERGEPMTEMNGGGVVFGNMMMPGKKQKFKNYAADLSKTEAKQNKIMDKATKLVLDADDKDPFGRISLNSSQASLIGANMKLKNIAGKKQDAADLQSAILETAEEMGLVADDLAKGKIKKAKFGGKMTAQLGYKFNPDTRRMELIDELAEYNSITEPTITNQQFKMPSSMATSNFGGVDIVGNVNQQYVDPPKEPTRVGKALQFLGKGVKKGFEKYGETVLSNVAPFLRPTDQEGLDPSQLYPEMLTLSSNQLEPVQAQKFQPQLGGVMDVSYQDQLNEITAQSRAAERMMQNNPEAAANLFAQVAQAKSRVLGEQTRANMASRKQTFDENRNLSNESQLKNLQILDQQYVRQAQAKSNTKAQAQVALNSIADKIAKNKLENRQLGIMENMYNYRFGPNGQAINMNPLAQINMGGSGKTSSSQEQLDEDSEYTYTKDSSGKYKIKGVVKKGKDSALNGSIVKSLKRI